jgi:cephalosporin-C deacetylase
MAATSSTRPADFDAYWAAVDDELARFPAVPTLERLALPSDEHSTVYAVKITSSGPYRIFGYLSIPNAAGTHPGLVYMPGYGSVNHLPHLDDRQRYVTLILMHRGQRLADQPFAAAYPGLLTLGIDDPGTYIFRSIVADCLRGAEFLLSRPEVDTSRVGIIGNDLALITAARRPRFSTVQASGLLFHRLMEVLERTEAYPVEELNDYLRTYPDKTEAVARTLSYFEPAYHAAGIKGTTLFNGGGSGVKLVADAVSGTVEQYELTHEGGTDHDWADAWMAKQLGSVPKPRLWDVA